MPDDEQMMSGEQFAQRNRAAAPGAAHQQGQPGQPARPDGQQQGQPAQQGQPGPQGQRPAGPPPGWQDQRPGQQSGQHPQGPRPPQPGGARRADQPAQHRGAPTDGRTDARSGGSLFHGEDEPARSPHASWGPPPERTDRRAPEPPAPPRGPVSADDFLQGRQRSAPLGPASWGWRGLVRRLTFGLIKPAMGRQEQEHHQDRSTVQRSFDGPKTIVFVNPKGGAAKTTSVLMSGYTFGTVRGGGIVAWDNNETRGTLGVRGLRASHNNTARELLAARDRFSDVYSARLGDLGGYVRSQGEAHFDLLASDEQPGVTGTIHADDFRNLHQLLNRFYRMVLVDTGNNIRAENWLAAVDSADLLVVTTTVREDTGYSGLWMLDALVAEGRGDLVERSVTILSDPVSKVDDELASSLTEAYASRSRHVVRVPFDPILVSGSVVDYSRLSHATRSAWLRACARMAESL